MHFFFPAGVPVPMPILQMKRLRPLSRVMTLERVSEPRCEPLPSRPFLDQACQCFQGETSPGERWSYLGSYRCDRQSGWLPREGAGLLGIEMEEVERASSYDVTQKHRYVVTSSFYSLRLTWGAGALSWGARDGQRPVLEAAAKPPRRGQGEGVECGSGSRGKEYMHTPFVIPCPVLSLAEKP